MEDNSFKFYFSHLFIFSKNMVKSLTMPHIWFDVRRAMLSLTTTVSCIACALIINKKNKKDFKYQVNWEF